jgi:hypothetical protein
MTSALLPLPACASTNWIKSKYIHVCELNNKYINKKKDEWLLGTAKGEI